MGVKPAPRRHFEVVSPTRCRSGTLRFLSRVDYPVIPNEDRRRYRRVPLRVPVGITAGSDGPLTETTTVDLSLGGMSVQASDGLELGREVTVVINGGGRIIPARAKVVRRIPPADGLGLQFLRVTPGPRRTLRTWLGEGLSPGLAP